MLFQVWRSKPLKCFPIVLAWMLVGGTIGYVPHAQAGDPGGDKTGVATDAQSAGGDAFIIPEPDA